MDQPDNTVRIEIYIGQGGKEGFTSKYIYLPFIYPRLSSFHGVESEPLEGMDEKILKGGNIRLLSANPCNCTPFTFCRLFALITKHDFTSFSWLKVIWNLRDDISSLVSLCNYLIY